MISELEKARTALAVVWEDDLVRQLGAGLRKGLPRDDEGKLLSPLTARPRSSTRGLQGDGVRRSGGPAREHGKARTARSGAFRPQGVASQRQAAIEAERLGCDHGDHAPMKREPTG